MIYREIMKFLCVSVPLWQAFINYGNSVSDEKDSLLHSDVGNPVSFHGNRISEIGNSISMLLQSFSVSGNLISELG
jgi:hypothetical protein